MCSSFSEKKAKEFLKTSKEEFISFNKMAISRTYPSGVRVNSSNYDPHIFWSCGCQLVALNYQTFGNRHLNYGFHKYFFIDRGMQLNTAMFQDNGGCGYILKPEYLRMSTQRPVSRPYILILDVTNIAWLKL